MKNYANIWFVVRFKSGGLKLQLLDITAGLSEINLILKLSKKFLPIELIK